MIYTFSFDDFFKIEPYTKFPEFREWLEETFKDSDVAYEYPMNEIGPNHFVKYHDHFESTVVEERGRILDPILFDMGFRSSEHITNLAVVHAAKKKKKLYFLEYQKTTKRIIHAAKKEVSRL